MKCKRGFLWYNLFASESSDLKIKGNIMAFKFCSFASGSSGNCYLVSTDTTHLLIDTGITGKKIFEGLSKCGLEPEDLDGILITHEHTDHIKSLRIVSKKAVNALVYASQGTLDAVSDKISSEKSFTVDALSAISIGDIEVSPFTLSHDAAEPLGFSLMHEGRRITIVTDTGCITGDAFDYLVNSDLYVLEANHEKNILLMGSYPYSLKRRILGDEGHLSNESAAEIIIRALGERTKEEIPKIALSHLSRENNTPRQAYLTIKSRLMEEGYVDNRDFRMFVLERDIVGEIIKI